MISVGVRELRQNASVILRRVAAGESIIVTDRGRPVARISSMSGSGGAADLGAAGRVRQPMRRMRDAPPAVAVGEGGLSAEQAISSARADER